MKLCNLKFKPKFSDCHAILFNSCSTRQCGHINGKFLCGNPIVGPAFVTTKSPTQYRVLFMKNRFDTSHCRVGEYFVVSHNPITLFDIHDAEVLPLVHCVIIRQTEASFYN